MGLLVTINQKAGLSINILHFMLISIHLVLKIHILQNFPGRQRYMKLWHKEHLLDRTSHETLVTVLLPLSLFCLFFPLETEDGL